ncbi:MAG: tetratricopeptide repeat protein [Bryobacteraceae bacterium]
MAPPEAAANRRERRPYLLAGAALTAALLAAFWAYGPALHGPFLFDDTVLPFLLSAASAPLLAWMRGVRPLLMASYWLNTRISGDDPFSYHVLNVVIHVAAAVLIFLIVRRLLEWSQAPAARRTMLAGFAGGLFLLHPMQTEAVAYVAGRSEVLSVMLVLAAYAVFLYRRKAAFGWGAVLLVAVLFGAAVLSKEQTIMLPALLLLTDFWWNPGFSWRGARDNWRLYAPLALGAAAAVAFYWKQILYSPSAGFSLRGVSWYQYLFTQGRALLVYPAEFLFPVRLTADWDFPFSHTAFDHGAIFGLAALVALAAAAWHYRRRFPLACFGFLAYLVLMAPTSSILPIADPLAERRIYLGMLGLLLMVVDLLARIRVDTKKLTAALAAVLLAATLATHARAAVWSDPIALWQDTATKSPHKRRVLFQLASAYADAGRCQDAVEEYEKVAQEWPPNYDMLIDWGLAYDCVNQPDLALEKLRQAARMEPTAHVYTQIAKVYAERRRWAEALDALATAEKLDPSFATTYAYRGKILFNLNRAAEAVADYQRALALQPSLADVVRPDLAAAEARLAGH